MSGIWQHASKQNPCPICGKPDWCTFGQKAMLCQRVQSEHPHVKGGWYHFYDSASSYRPPELKPKEAPRPLENAADWIKKWRMNTSRPMFYAHAESLGVLAESLIAIGACWAQEHRAWAFPMYDGAGNIVGIRLRSTNGFKWAVPGSRQGVFVPNPSVHPRPVAFLPEGPTDTAAALSIGLYAIGRPTCNFDSSVVRDTLRRIGIYTAVIVEDNDKPIAGTGKRPGSEGARKLKSELGISSVIWKPSNPHKDLRAFVSAGGTAEMIMSQVNQKVWSKK